MTLILLPVEEFNGENSATRTCAINKEVWSITRPDSIKSASDVTQYYFATNYNPTTNQWAIAADSDEQVKIHPDVDLTILLSILPNITQTEKDQLLAYINANRGGSVPFYTLIPPSSIQLTKAEAITQGWDVDSDEVITDYI